MAWTSPWPKMKNMPVQIHPRSAPEVHYSGPFYDYRTFMERRYGKALHKVPVDFNYGCPHRTAEHHGGCTFCPEDGSRASQIDGLDNLTDQIEAAVAFAKQRYGAVGFTAYVQAYTATFAPVSKFKEQMVDILSKFPFDSLHLGTRPDCLPASTLDYLKVLSEQIDLWVELGLQTIHDKTLLRIQREHDWACSVKGIEKLKSKGLQVVSHIILGLPGESKADMIETAKVMAQLPLDGIKIHNLHVIEKTQLAVEYREQAFHLLGELEYIEIVAEFLRHLPADLPIMRINTDTPPKELVAPHWNMQKGQLRERLIRYMEMMDICQGDLYVGKELGLGELAQQSYLPFDEFALRPQERPQKTPKFVATLDGSFTMMDEYCGEPYHPRHGAIKSCMERFIYPANIQKILRQKPLLVLDIGFGTGLNSLLTLNEALKIQTLATHPLSIHAFEQNRRATLAFQGQHQLLDHLDGNAMLGELRQTDTLTWPMGHSLKMHWGDARYHLQGMSPNSVDVIFLDPFDEKNNTELVSIELIQWLAHLLKEDGILCCSRSHPAVVYSCLAAGLKNQKTCKSGSGLSAKKESFDISLELATIESDSRSQPYRDPSLCWSHKDIVRQRNTLLP